MGVDEVLAKLRVNSGLRPGAPKKLGFGWQVQMGYENGPGRGGGGGLFVVWLTRPDGKTGTMRLPPEDVETRGRSNWMTGNTWRLSARGIEHVGTFIEQYMGAWSG